MKVEHIAIYTQDIERLKKFYIKYFGAKSNEGYYNKKTGFRSYFLNFEENTRIEIMSREGILLREISTEQNFGYSHLAISVDTMFAVMRLTKTLEEDGYEVISRPRKTGDGYFESVILDPDGNRIEITR